MKAEAALQNGPRKRTKRRILVWVLAIVVVLAALVVFLVPWFVSSEMGREIILAKINGSIDGEADFSNLSMSWWKGIKVEDFSFNDGAGQTLIEAKQITTKPHYGSILTGSLSLGETIVDEPKVEINLAGSPAKMGEGFQQREAAVERSEVRALPIKKIDLVINEGNLKVTDRGGETVEVAGINCALTLNINLCRDCPTARARNPLAKVETEAKLGFERCEYMGFRFGPTEVDIQIHKGLMRIAPFSTTVNNGQLNFAGEADFKEEPTLLKTPRDIEIMKDIQINEVTTDKLLMYVNPVFANAVNVSGVANFNCEQLAIPLAEATKNDLEVIGTISINRLRLEASDLLGQILSVAGASARGQDITINPTRFVLQDGFLRYDDMEMVVGDKPVNFGGVIGLDKTLNMTVTLPYTTRGRTVKVGEIEAGERISLPLRGTIDKPELDLGKLFEEQLKQQLEERLQEALEELLK
ncbi:MAG: hypothetical protein ACYS0C_05560 [Planctomycetota bacterium]